MNYTVFVVSDGTGRTAQQALEAALTQFPEIKVDIRVKPHVWTKNKIQSIIKETVNTNAFILHTIVKSEIRNEIVRLARINNVETIDLMGPLLSRLSQQFSHTPTQKPDVFYRINKEYFKRIDAMHFAFNHDDGLRIHEIDKAEIVLVGVSRTFKTPLSIYFAFKGWLVANIPIIKNLEPPQELFNIPPDRVFCLTTTPRSLSILRKVRELHLGKKTGDYATINYVQSELNYANSIFRRQPLWSVIDVSGKPIEEIATEILAFKKTTDY